LGLASVRAWWGALNRWFVEFDIGGFGTETAYVYRGQEDSSWPLQQSLLRHITELGLAEDEAWYDDDEDGSAAHDDLERTYRERPNVRRIDRQRGRGQVEVEDIFPDEDPPRSGKSSRSRRTDGGASTAVLRPAEVRAARAAGEIAKVHLIAPRSFNDAQQIADRFKRDIPVIINLQNSDAALGKRTQASEQLFAAGAPSDNEQAGRSRCAASQTRSEPRS
jgi:cell division inhibitor SepF